MTVDIEQDLRQIFATDAAHAPVPHDLADGARRRAHAQARRQRRVAVLACAAVAAVVVGGFALLQRPTADHSAPAATRPAPTPTSSATQTPVQDQDGTRPALRYHNVEVPVPGSMLSPDAVRCGTPVADAAYVVTAPARRCNVVVAHPERLTTVVLQLYDAPKGVPTPPTGTRVLPDGRTQVVSAIPGDLRMIVTSPDPQRAHRLFDGLVIVQMSNGCAVKETATRSDTLPPAVYVRGGSACVYDTSHQLVASGWLDKAQAQRIVAAVALAQQPVPCPHRAGPPTGVDHWTVHLRTPTRDVTFRVD